MSRRPDVDELADGVRRSDRRWLARAITLVESTRDEDRDVSMELVEKVLGETGGAQRVGITGVPGVGKSTLIDALGSLLTSRGHRVAVLAVDPSSKRSGGSILGDKTRMTRLSRDPNAFVRPSPSGDSIGGIARRTREALLLCEAAGHDIVLVETVGVGQSETVVHDMVDFFLLLALPGAGDELQGIKRGILELADLVAVNKADGETLRAAESAASELGHALHFVEPKTPDWSVRVLTCSAVEETGLEEIWEAVAEHRERHEASGAWAERRRRQAVEWTWRIVRDDLLTRFRGDPRVAAALPALEADLESGRTSPDRAARRLLDLFGC